MSPDKQQALLQAVERIEGTCATIRSILLGDEAIIQDLPAQPIPKPKDKLHQRATCLPASELGPTPQYNVESWPPTVNPNQIVRDEATKRYRALQIASIIGAKYDRQRILDCGCGDGHLAKELAIKATQTVGYDIQQAQSWVDAAKLRFTTDKAVVESTGPYDLIIAYDVLDHLLDAEPAQFLTWLRGLLAPKGRIFLRVHPWTAKHGSHLYETVNKAFLHLALTPDELAQDGYTVEHNLKIVRPLSAYEQWLRKAQLKVDDKRVISEPPDEFFGGPILDRIIKVTWGGSIEPEKALKIMATCFIDYWLSAE